MNKVDIKAMETAMNYIEMARGLLNRVLDNEEKTSEEKGVTYNPQLDSKRTFLNYIEGDSNELARTVGLSIAEQEGELSFNPLLVYGPSGCGKTHLINAVGGKFKELNPQKNVFYVGARQFQMQYTDSVRQNTIDEFRNFYLSADMLIVDDVQEWMDAPKTLDCFFNIFNHLVSSGKQIILAGDRPPVKLKGMRKDLLSRFASGLVAEIEAPDEQLRLDILRAKSSQAGLDIQDEVIEYIAKNVKSNVCDLEGVVNSLKAYSMVNTIFDKQLAECVIKRLVNGTDKVKNDRKSAEI